MWYDIGVIQEAGRQANIDTINNTENNNKLESTAHCSTFLLGDMNSKYECILTDFNTTNVTRKDELF